MCGICGILPRDRQQLVEPATIEAMRDALVHRGPDDSGSLISPGIALGHRRLSIIDLSSNGRQPFASADERYQIVYNGEIYNYRELRQDLERRGWRFRTGTDTEVLLTMFQEYGADMLHRLNGMFAFAIWDAAEQELFLARDRLGVKPLYYAENGEGFYFASEPKALFAAGVDPAIDESRIDELLLFRFVAGDRTLFRNVRKLKPGHALRIRADRQDMNRWWCLAERARAVSPPGDPVRWYGETLADSVGYRLISDVPVGILLSGGLDSSSIAALVAERGSDQRAAFTVGFDEAEYDESHLARIVADRYGFQFHELRLTGEDLHGALQDASWYLDEPIAHQNDPQLLAVSRLAKQNVSVLLSGEGSDETLGGYVRYRPLKYLSLLRMGTPFMGLLPLAKRLRTRVHKHMKYLRAGDVNHLVMYNTCNFFPGYLQEIGIRIDEQRFEERRLLQDEAARAHPGSPFRQAMYLDQHLFLCSLLDRNDRMTMGASIECREPFLDPRIVETLSALPDACFARMRRGKYLLLRSAAASLPAEIRTHRKWGFSVPWERHFRNVPVFRDELEHMHANPIFEAGVLRLLDVRGMVRDFLNGDNSHALLLRQLYMIDVWQRTYAERLSRQYVPAY